MKAMIKSPNPFPKVQDKLRSNLPSDSGACNRIIWASFLVQEGASAEIKNKKGKSVLELCGNQYADSIMQFKRTKGYECIYA